MKLNKIFKNLNKKSKIYYNYFYYLYYSVINNRVTVIDCHLWDRSLCLLLIMSFVAHKDLSVKWSSSAVTAYFCDRSVLSCEVVMNYLWVVILWLFCF